MLLRRFKVVGYFARIYFEISEMESLHPEPHAVVFISVIFGRDLPHCLPFEAGPGKHPYV